MVCMVNNDNVEFPDELILRVVIIFHFVEPLLTGLECYMINNIETL